MVSLVSTGLAIARPHRKGNSPADEFIPSGLNAEGGTLVTTVITRAAGPSAGFRAKTRDFVGDATFRSKALRENRRTAIILGQQYCNIPVLRGITGVQ